MIRFLNAKEIARTNISHKDSMIKGFAEILKNGKYINGKHVEDFERRFARYCGNAYCVSVNSGTDGLMLSLRNIDIKAGDEVLLPSVSFIATALAPIHLGAKLRFVDIDLNTYNIDYDLLLANITTKTKAIISVHWAGRPLDRKRLNSIRKKTGIPVIEDAAHAAGAFDEYGPIGSSDNHTVFSFFPTKNLSCMGDGGAIVVSSKKDSERLKLSRNFGRIGREAFKCLGRNSRLDEIQAMILLKKLKFLDVENNKRRKLAELYNKYLDKGIVRPDSKAVSGHTYHLYIILLPAGRDKIQKELIKRGIECATHYKMSLHRHLPKIGFKQYRKFDLENTDEYERRCLSLPMYPSLSDEDIIFICKNINKVI